MYSFICAQFSPFFFFFFFFWEEQKKMVEVDEPLLETNDKKGGFRTLPFIIANEAFEKMATYGLMPNMAFYLMKQYNMKMTTASNVMLLWSAATNFMPLLGAIIADSYLGRFYTIGFGSIICLLGMILLWTTTIIPQARPLPCHQSTDTCDSASIFQFVYLCVSLGLISIGAGGIRASSLAFGANQLEKGGGFQSVKESYFSWYYASYTISVLVALTCVVYIQDNMGWGVGFAVPAVLMLFAVISFFLASSFYIKSNSKTSLVTGFVQVLVASFRNRHLELSDGKDVVYHYKNGSTLVFPSRNLRFLNKACIVKDPPKDLISLGNATDPWSLCTINQVEGLKALIRVVPIWSTGMIMSINISQNSFPVLQAASVDRQITSNFTIPAASFSTFTVIAIIIWVVLYDRFFLPLASRIMKKPVHLSTRSRMGFGIFLSFLAMMVTSVTESIRRVVMHMSAVWLVPQYCLIGFAEASNAIAQNEFYFSELPGSMSSIASSLNGIGCALANILASLLLYSVDSVSKAGANESWISDDINKGHYDYYYLILAGLSLANMVYFLVCSSCYGTLKEERKLEEEDIVYLE
ncbi:hypothetical protein ACJIZ3_006383 [Penstemon smallii]|uniref:Uncharacterized protein n=1 Tax=Penstemon smallii TaxID=265156 RepID=A0ABD3S7L4_9LAMI